MYLFLVGIAMLSAILGLFWMKDQLESPLLARHAYSGLVARLAVLSAGFSLLGLVLMIAEYAEKSGL